MNNVIRKKNRHNKNNKLFEINQLLLHPSTSQQPNNIFVLKLNNKKTQKRLKCV